MGLFEKLLRGMTGGHHGGYGGYGGKHGGGHRGDYGPAYPQPSAIGCPRCGAANPEPARFCQQCGASLASAPCAACGAQLTAAAKFCAQCGKPRGAG